jgi:hypothetical protein
VEFRTRPHMRLHLNQLSGSKATEKAQTYLQLPLRQWGAGNVYLLVFRHNLVADN